MRCANCGTEYPDGAVFCPNCGTPAAQQTTQQQAGTAYDSIGATQYGGYTDAAAQQAPSPTYGAPVQGSGYSAGGAHCPSCGAELKPGATFCEVCGAQVSAPAWQTPEPKKSSTGKIVGIVAAVVAVLLVVVIFAGGSDDSSSSSSSSGTDSGTETTQGQSSDTDNSDKQSGASDQTGQFDGTWLSEDGFYGLEISGSDVAMIDTDNSNAIEGTIKSDGTVEFEDGTEMTIALDGSSLVLSYSVDGKEKAKYFNRYDGSDLSDSSSATSLDGAWYSYDNDGDAIMSLTFDGSNAVLTAADGSTLSGTWTSDGVMTFENGTVDTMTLTDENTLVVSENGTSYYFIRE